MIDDYWPKQGPDFTEGLEGFEATIFRLCLTQTQHMNLQRFSFQRKFRWVW